MKNRKFWNIIHEEDLNWKLKNIENYSGMFSSRYLYEILISGYTNATRVWPKKKWILYDELFYENTQSEFGDSTRQRVFYRGLDAWGAEKKTPILNR